MEDDSDVKEVADKVNLKLLEEDDEIEEFPADKTVMEESYRPVPTMKFMQHGYGGGSFCEVRERHPVLCQVR